MIKILLVYQIKLMVKIIKLIYSLIRIEWWSNNKVFKKSLIPSQK